MTLLELLTLLRKHLKLVIMLPIVCMVAMGLASVLMMSDTYTATTDMYVLASSEGSNSSSALSSDLSASQMLTNDVATLLQSDRVMSDAADQLGLPNLRGYNITVTSESTTRVITLQVTSSDAQGSANVANALADCVSNVAQEVMNVESVNVIDEAPTPEAPSGPNRMLYVAVAAMAGLFAAVAIVVLMDVIDTRVRSAEDVEELLELPVIGRIPEMKGGR
ncbi:MULTISPECIES: YveK family protein [Enorma]|uniref:Lipopolysaccharide biosynthesis protein n=1 Tax=Enorma shizhengliae TaxID=2606615 RepID=A0A7K0G795_9ACTN|nr:MULTISPECIES: Wzz/FepE/Etk N-terminal domain-containing protein [Enorma]MRX79673.1 lipopolysaccharide biosynthesis protein [Enorma shizhengliae]HJG61759.1 lipopolysaccharide biosynthesis protein [Enorma massiliensis]